MTEPATFPPTRSAALAKLARFVPHAGRTYARRRNYDLGPGRHEAVSLLSPYLRSRTLTEVDVLTAVLGRHSQHAAEKFVQEVFWRTYWKGWLELRPEIWSQYQQDLKRHWNGVQTQSGLRARWQAACCGETGIDCLDSWAHELVQTGYLHNHARMWFASIWIFTLELPWQLGADFFLRHLHDGDPASNTLSWRWVAGLQTAGKTYLARTSNITKYTEGRFAPTWPLASNAPALQGPPPPTPRSLQSDQTPDPERATGFLLHEDDLSPEFALQGIKSQSHCLLSPRHEATPLHMAPQVIDFRRNLMADTATRWTGRLGGTPHQADTADQILTWARTEGIEQIVTAHAPVGPVADVLATLTRLDGAPVVIRQMRAYDRAAWPHATKGFFAFKKKIPDLILQFL